METIFDKILRKEVPAKIIYEDEYVLAFNDLAPQASVHILVIPKKRAASLYDLKDWTLSEVGSFLTRVGLVASLLDLDRSGYRVVINSGDHGGQTVHYLHAHILGGESLQNSFGA